MLHTQRKIYFDNGARLSMLVTLGEIRVLLERGQVAYGREPMLRAVVPASEILATLNEIPAPTWDV